MEEDGCRGEERMPCQSLGGRARALTAADGTLMETREDSFFGEGVGTGVGREEEEGMG